MNRSFAAGLCAAICALLLILTLTMPAQGAVSWTGTGGTSWATAGSWTPSGGPSTTDTASFTDTGATTLFGDVTSVLNITRTIGGLSFLNTSGKFQTLDLNTKTLTINGNMNFNVDQSTGTTTTTIRNGAIIVNSAFANLNVGRGISGGSNVNVDFSGMTSLTATLQSMQIGASTAGVATGTLTLSPSNTITAGLILVGASTNSQETNGTLHLGLNNVIQTPEFDIAKDNSYGRVDIVNGGSLTLGTAAQRTLLQLANQTTNTGATYSAVMNLGNATVNLHLDSLIVAEKYGGPGTVTAQLVGGVGGSVAIGDPSVRSNWHVGYTVNGGATQGTVNFGQLTTLQANLNELYIGFGVVGNGTGTVTLAPTSTLDVSNNIIVGAGGSDSFGTLTLGRLSTTILANQLIIGRDYSYGLVQIPNGGTLNLGSAASRTSLIISNSSTNTPTAYYGKMDLTGGILNAFTGDIIVGQRITGVGATLTGIFIAGNGGTMDIGAPGNSANFYVGRGIGGGATGTADLSGLSSVTASLNTLTIGNGIAAGASGTVKLGVTNNISANTILVGVGYGDSSGTLVLGKTNTILVHQLTISQDYSYGSVTIPSGGSLTLGSPAQRTNITMATGTTNTGNVYSGILDLTNATFVAYLDNVIIGDKNNQPGVTVGTFTISSNPANHIEANAITLGGNQSTGTINYGGGVFFAGSITGGAGTANFNWTGGTLSVGTFGSLTRLFNLNNTGSGTLAPGAANGAIGTTSIFGNYVQASSASMAIRIAGSTPGVGNDQVNISGSATLAGTLKLSLINSFTPSVGQNCLIATYASRSGTFAFVAPPALPQDVAFQLDYTGNPNQLVIHMVSPVAQNWTSTAAAASFSTPGNWDTLIAPTTTSADAIVNSSGVSHTVTVSSSTTVHRITLSGTSPLFLEVPQGIQLGVSNQLVIGPNASLIGGGQVLGQVVINAGGSVVPAVGGTGMQIGGNVINSGLVIVPTGSTLNVAGNVTQTSGGGTTGTGTVVANAFFDTLNVTGQMQVRANASTSRLNTLAIATVGNAFTGKLDLANNGMILQATGAADKAAKISLLKAAILSGSANGWTGNGLTSSTVAGDAARYSIGVFDNGVLGKATFGDAGAVNANAILVSLALIGDANFDGFIGAPDLNAIAAHWHQSANNWAAGDLNGDGFVDSLDVNIVVNDWNQGGYTPLISTGPTFSFSLVTVPEPGTVALLAVGALLLVRRKRNRKA